MTKNVKTAKNQGKEMLKELFSWYKGKGNKGKGKGKGKFEGNSFHCGLPGHRISEYWKKGQRNERRKR